MNDQTTKPGKAGKPDLKIIPDLKSDNPFDPENLSIGADDLVVGKKLLIGIAVRTPDKFEFFRTHPDPAFCFNTFLLPYERGEFFLVPKAMRGEVPEAKPFEVHLCVSRPGALFWWPIRIPEEDGKTYLWWETAREISRLARDSWVRIISDRASNSYQPVVISGCPIRNGRTLTSPS